VQSSRSFQSLDAADAAPLLQALIAKSIAMELLVLIFIVIAVVVALLQNAGKKGGSRYIKRKGFLSAAERSFFGVLGQSVSSDIYVTCKVRVADVLAPAKGQARKDWQVAFNRISAKHFDYVLCSAGTMEVVAAVELDDRSHGSKKAKARDAFLNNACEQSGLPLVRFPARKSYEISEVREKLEMAINQSNKSPASQAGTR